jgi:hypothetical protein
MFTSFRKWMQPNRSFAERMRMFNIDGGAVPVPGVAAAHAPGQINAERLARFQTIGIMGRPMPRPERVREPEIEIADEENNDNLPYVVRRGRRGTMVPRRPTLEDSF